MELNAVCMGFLLFLNQFSEFKGVDECPEIEQVSLKFLQNLACEDSECPARAYYNKDNKIIYLLDEMDMEDTMSKSILVHELVHFAQDVSGNWRMHEDDCRAAMQRELYAFRVQEIFLRNNNLFIPVSHQMMFYTC